MNQFEIDTLLMNGKIYTLKEEGDFVEAVGIDRGKIVFTGSMTDSAVYTAKNTINLKGKTVIPGLGDSHLHFYAYCQNQATVMLEEAKSLAEVISMMKEKAAVSRKGEMDERDRIRSHQIYRKQDADKMGFGSNQYGASYCNQKMLPAYNGCQQPGNRNGRDRPAKAG